MSSAREATGQVHSLLDFGGKSQRQTIKELKGRVNQKTVINFYLHFAKVGEPVGDCSDTYLTSQFKIPLLKMED